MPRHFYLYSSPSPLPTPTSLANKTMQRQRFPIACIATQADPHIEPNYAVNGLDVLFAVATYNPADVGVLPFSRKVARARSAGRLQSPRHRILLRLPYIQDEPPAKQYARIMRAVCTDMAKGAWAAAHPGAHSAIAAALLWLDHDTARAAQWAANKTFQEDVRFNSDVADHLREQAGETLCPHGNNRPFECALCHPPEPPLEIIVAPEEASIVDAIFAGEAVMEAKEAHPIDSFEVPRSIEDDAIDLDSYSIGGHN